MPCNRHAMVEFVAILRMYLRSVFHGSFDAFSGRHRGKLKSARGIESQAIGCRSKAAEQHTFAGAAVPRAGIGNLADGQIGKRDAAVDRLILLPKSSFEL